MEMCRWVYSVDLEAYYTECRNEVGGHIADALRDGKAQLCPYCKSPLVWSGEYEREPQEDKNQLYLEVVE